MVIFLVCIHDGCYHISFHKIDQMQGFCGLITLVCWLMFSIDDILYTRISQLAMPCWIEN